VNGFDHTDSLINFNLLERPICCPLELQYTKGSWENSAFKD
jgi:hypothetical protein